MKFRTPFAFVFALSACAASQPKPTPADGNWCGLPNFSVICETMDFEVIRSADPTSEQLACIAEFAAPRGGLHIFRLCRPSEGCETVAPPGATLYAFDMPPYTDQATSALGGPSVGDLNVIAGVLRRIAKGVVLVHCVHGVDRTSLVSGMAAVIDGGRTKDQAFLEQAMEHGMRPFPGLLAAWSRWDPTATGSPGAVGATR